MAHRFRPCIVVPVYDHDQALPALVAALAPYGIDCWLVDDGSGPACAAVIERLAAGHGWLRRLRLERNSGKGAAVMAGLRAAFEAGFSHGLQIDADLQHDPHEVMRFFEIARAHPDAVVSGVARYDATVPKVRLYGRSVTHALVWVHTLSFAIRDSMCGLRVYPLAPVVALDRQHPVGRRMQFDTDVFVRLYWRGVPVVNVPTPVTYPADGVSHFDMLRDNVRLAGMHGRLFAGMLVRMPVLIGRRLRRRS